MVKKLLTTSVLGLCLAALTFAQRPQAVIGAGLGAPFKSAYFQTVGTVRTLSADTAYILTGIYYVDSTAVLNIQPGTVVLGDSASGGTLCIKRGGKIYANGTAQRPIVLTTKNAAGDRRAGACLRAGHHRPADHSPAGAFSPGRIGHPGPLPPAPGGIPAAWRQRPPAPG